MRVVLAVLRANTAAVAALLVLGLLLGGCDKCGDLTWNKPGSCRGYGPSQR